MYVAGHFFKVQRLQLAAQADALFELTQLVGIHFVIQLWLSHQHNLEELLPFGFQIREKPDFFQHISPQILRFIHNQRGGKPPAVTLHEKLIEGNKQIGLTGGGMLQAEVDEHVLQEFARIQCRIEDISEGHIALL